MAVERVSTFNIFQTTLNSASKAQADLANLQNQLSSGLKSQNFAGIADQSMQYLQLQDKLTRTDRYIASNGTIRIRLQTTATTLTQVIDTGTKLKSLIQQYGQSQASGGVFEEQLNDLWRTLTGQLNVSVDGRYLFAGSATATPPVDSDSFPTLAALGTPDDSYYLGNDNDLTARIDDNLQVTYNVRANDPSIQKIFAALAMAKQGNASGSSDIVTQALAMAEQGVEGVISLQTRVNSNIVTLDNIDDSLTSLKTYWKGVGEEISNTDLVAVSTQVAINEAILQASFQSYGRILALRLSDYLR